MGHQKLQKYVPCLLLASMHLDKLTRTYAHITVQCTEVQENNFQILAYEIVCYKNNKAPQLPHLVCCWVFLKKLNTRF